MYQEENEKQKRSLKNFGYCATLKIHACNFGLVYRARSF